MATKKQILFPVGILASALVIFSVFVALKKPPEEKVVEEFIPVVKIQKIEISDLPMIVNSQGMVMPKEKTILVAQVGGKITKLSIAFVRGGFVKSGDVLAWIDDSDYKTQLIEAQANLASARASLQQEKAKGHVAEREWQQVTNSSPSELGLRKPQLAQEVARVRAATAGVSRAERNLERTHIIAPYDAIIDSKSVGLGSFVGGGSVIGELSRIDVGEIRLPIADKDLQFLTNQGVNAQVSLHAQFNGKPAVWQGIIIRNEGIIDSKSRMNYLVAQVATPYGLEKPLRFGSYVSAHISGITIPNATIVPRHLIEERGLAFLTKNNLLHFEAIEVIRQQGGNVVISGELHDFDQLVISALDIPVEGMKLTLLNTDKLAVQATTSVAVITDEAP
jgi:RND family efflux transporter MFP subunit